eukprot:12751048-Prorocentrum_lima.AAC.1
MLDAVVVARSALLISRALGLTLGLHEDPVGGHLLLHLGAFQAARELGVDLGNLGAGVPMDREISLRR